MQEREVPALRVRIAAADGSEKRLGQVRTAVDLSDGLDANRYVDVVPITGVVQRKFALLDRHLLELHNAVSGVSKEQFAND